MFRDVSSELSPTKTVRMSQEVFLRCLRATSFEVRGGLGTEVSRVLVVTMHVGGYTTEDLLLNDDDGR